MARHSLCRGIHLVKGSRFVEIPVTKWGHDVAQEGFDEMEITQKLFMIKLCPRNRHHHSPVVSMQTLTHSTKHDGVRGGKLAFDLKRK